MSVIKETAVKALMVENDCVFTNEKKKQTEKKTEMRRLKQR